jgi:hypothetical protein
MMNPIIETKSILVIEKFLQQWKEKSFIFYKDLQSKYFEESNKRYEITRENLESIIGMKLIFKGRITNELIEQILQDLSTMPNREKENLKVEIHHCNFTRFCYFYGPTSINICQKSDQDINKILDRELAAKRQNLITRITKKAGNILDASGLYIANNGEINGWIMGDIKTVKVETISAGGYNIQCYHFRVLVK